MGDSFREPGFPGSAADRGFGPPEQQRSPGCAGGPETVTRFRRLAAPNLRNASIDKLDSCNEVSIGLIATLAITGLISVIALPFFDIAGMSWIRTWEGSYMMSIGRLKHSLDQSDLRLKAMDMSFLVQHLDYDTVSGNPALLANFEDAMKTRCANEVGPGVTKDDVTLKMSPVGAAPPANSASAAQVQQQEQQQHRLLRALSNEQVRQQEAAEVVPGILCQLSANISGKTDTDELEGILQEALPEISKGMEYDLNQYPALKDVAAPHDIKVVNRSVPTARIDATPAFEWLDQNSDGLVDLKEFANTTASFKFNQWQATHAFDGLNENGDQYLEAEEFAEAIDQKDFFHHSDRSFTTRITTTSGSWTATTTSTATATTTMVIVPHPISTNLISTTAVVVSTSTVAPTTTITTTTMEEAKYVSIRLALDSLTWSALSREDQGRLASSYQGDLAFAAGLLPSQVSGIPDALGPHKDCVSGGAGHKDEAVLQACLPIPDGATVEDLEAVVTVSTMKRKILSDFQKVVGSDALDMRAHVDIEVTAQGFCRATDGTPKGLSHFCQGEMPTDAQPEETTTIAAVITSTDAGAMTTSTAPSHVETTTGAPLPSKAEFFRSMGPAGLTNAQDAFAILDTNNNDFADLLEFEDVTKTFTPPLSLEQSKNMFDVLDLNHDGRVESMEFYQAFKQAETTGPPGANAEELLPLASYRKHLGHRARYRKVGVGLCRTAEKAWPPYSEYPEARSKPACLAICDTNPKCGAFAFKLGSDKPCKLYDNKDKENHSPMHYSDTTPMTDVECFARGYGDEANYDRARVRLTFDVGDTMKDLTLAQKLEIGKRLAESIAFEVGADVSDIKNVEDKGGKCTFSTRPSERLHDVDPNAPRSRPEAVCDVGLPNNRRIEDLGAVISADSTKQRIASELSDLPDMPRISLDQVETIVRGSSEKFRTADEDKNGVLDLTEFQKAVRSFADGDAAPNVFAGLDGPPADQVLTASEFEADGLRQYHTP